MNDYASNLEKTIRDYIRASVEATGKPPTDGDRVISWAERTLRERAELDRLKAGKWQDEARMQQVQLARPGTYLTCADVQFLETWMQGRRFDLILAFFGPDAGTVFVMCAGNTLPVVGFIRIRLQSEAERFLEILNTSTPNFLLHGLENRNPEELTRFGMPPAKASLVERQITFDD